MTVYSNVLISIDQGYPLVFLPRADSFLSRFSKGHKRNTDYSINNFNSYRVLQKERMYLEPL